MSARHVPRHPWRIWTVSLCLAGLTLLTIGCSEQTRYKVISFFFDGMPDPNAPPAADAGGVAAAGTSAVTLMVSRHQPYSEKNCAACHAKKAGSEELDVISLKPGLCVECHKPVANQYPVMHAPIARGACLWCHTAHESREPLLLRESPPKLCYQCHEQSLLSPETKEHADFRASCLNCHLAHGGPDHRLLRAVPIQPETRPARTRGRAP